jgi:acetyl esterase
MSAVPATGKAVVPLLFVHAVAFAQAAPVSVAPQPTTVQGAATHVYKSIDGSQVRLHVFSSNSPGPNGRPAIVFFFGGGWTQGSVTQFAPQARHFAERGMVAIVADYRVFGRHKTTPFEAMADAKSAIWWVRGHSAQLGIDSDRIVAAGGSAGGHIALSAAVFATFEDAGDDKTVSSRPNALVLFNPAVDTSQSSQFGGRGAEGSPFHHVGGALPPTIILHGTSDTTVPFVDVERFCEKARTFGNQCELVGYEGATHGFFNPQNADGRWYRETLLEADRFLTKIGFLKAPGSTQIP